MIHCKVNENEYKDIFIRLLLSLFLSYGFRAIFARFSLILFSDLCFHRRFVKIQLHLSFDCHFCFKIIAIGDFLLRFVRFS